MELPLKRSSFRGWPPLALGSLSGCHQENWPATMFIRPGWNQQEQKSLPPPIFDFRRAGAGVTTQRYWPGPDDPWPGSPKSRPFRIRSDNLYEGAWRHRYQSHAMTTLEEAEARERQSGLPSSGTSRAALSCRFSMDCSSS